MELKRLGNYIREVNLRNRDLKVTKPMGINIDKYFMSSVANVIGTDLSVYKLVAKKQFACNLMHVGRDERIPMAMLTDNNPIIVSPAYFVFEVVKQNDLLPEYLMMWFRRQEFDRNAWFYTDADVRGGLDKDALCNMRLPIPSITRQREIVSEYETLTHRIRLNEQMISKLEDTAQTLYRKMFVDGVDKENLPEGWRTGTIGDLFELQRGFDLPSQNRINGEFPIYASTGIAEYHNEYKIEPPCVITGRSGSIGEVFYVDKKCWPLNTTLWVKDFKNTPPFFVYYKLIELELEKTISGSAVPTLNRNDVHRMDSFIPPTYLLHEFDNEMKIIHNHLSITEQENSKLTELQSLLLARMGQ
ncbi:MAG: restriction endonuclease subunit S [Bacteroidales bacterium]|nr:restriction endonuclease subunit S [Bacteroidales bacterium]